MCIRDSPNPNALVVMVVWYCPVLLAGNLVKRRLSSLVHLQNFIYLPVHKIHHKIPTQDTEICVFNFCLLV